MSKHKKHIAYILFILATPFLFISCPGTGNTQAELSEQLLRLRVIAASDSDFDQAEKLAVKDAIVNLLSPEMSKASSKEEAIAIVNAHMDEILAISKNESSHTEVTASIANHYFPLKTYGSLTFPPGEYDTLLVTLGDAGGSNWWCVVYPPLCFVDASYGVVSEESDQQLKENLSEETYDRLHGEEPTVKIGFRLWELLVDLFS